MNDFLHRLRDAKVLSPDQAERIAHHEQTRPFPIHAELRTMLYLGVTALSAGLGVLIYQNLDTIGHQIITVTISALMLGCFGYVWQKRKPYADTFVRGTSPLPDYALLLGCLLFLTLEGFVQAQYNLFGTRYGLVTFLPAVLFMALAYRFDHRGVLAMGITALASWVGLVAAPLHVLTETALAAVPVRNTALIFGTVLTGAALALERMKIKPHFIFTYLLLAGNLAALAALFGWFGATLPFAYLAAVLAWCLVFGWYARRTQSFFFLLLAVVYGYVAVTYLVFRFLSEEMMVVLGMYYFVLTCGGILLLLFRYKRLLGIPTSR